MCTNFGKYAYKLRIANQESSCIDRMDTNIGDRPTSLQLLIGKPASRSPMGMYAMALSAKNLTKFFSLRSQPSNLFIKSPTMGDD